MAQPARLVISAFLLSLGLPWMLTVGRVATQAHNLQRPEAVTDAEAATLPVGESAADSTPVPAPPRQSTPAARPSITYFKCDPCLVEPGGPVTLYWDLSGATAAYLNGRGVTAPGSVVVYPDQTTTYRLVAIDDYGESEKSVTIQVGELPAIHYFTCLPCEIAKGEQSTLSWDLSGATAAYLSGHGVPAPGSSVVAPDQTTTYRLEAVGERGSVERLVTVTVREGGDPEAVSEALRNPGYDVRWVGSLSLAEPMESGGDTIAVIMTAATDDIRSQEFADQCFKGLKALYNNYPDQVLTVGLYNGVRHILFMTAESRSFEAFLRGEMDGQAFWQAVTFSVWDDWTERWLELDDLTFAHQDFESKRFGF